MPWPSQRDVRAWLQLLAVLQWVLSFLLLGEWGCGGCRAGRALTHPPHPTGPVTLVLLIYLVFTRFWPISALYLAWVIFDWDTPEKGTVGWGTLWTLYFSGSAQGNATSSFSYLQTAAGGTQPCVCWDGLSLPHSCPICRRQEVAVPEEMVCVEAFSGLLSCEGAELGMGWG